MVSKYTIFGERCSGTNYLDNIMQLNFNLTFTSEYGQKHFFGANEYEDSDDTLFIGIVRDPFAWFNSFGRDKHHLRGKITKSINNFLNTEVRSYSSQASFVSFNPNELGPLIPRNRNKEIINDRNPFTGEIFKNVMELRHLKLKYLIEEMPNRVKNYILIRYEDLRDNFEETVEAIRTKFALEIKGNIDYPVNTTQYKKTGKSYKPNSKKVVSREQVESHPDFNTQYEVELKYL